jgi:hypothetical protein
MSNNLAALFFPRPNAIAKYFMAWLLAAAVAFGMLVAALLALLPLMPPIGS